MQRVDSEEILDSDQCPVPDAETSLRDLCRINRWFGGVATTRNLVERVSSSTGTKALLVAGSCMPDMAKSRESQRRSSRKRESRWISPISTASLRIYGKGIVRWSPMRWLFPFRDESFDLVSCSLFAHHLDPENLARFVDEASRVSRCAVLINDLIRHPLHLALVFAGFPLMRSHVSRLDGVASVRRAYIPEEVRQILANGTRPAENVQISTHYLFRMGVIIWRDRPSRKAEFQALSTSAA